MLLVSVVICIGGKLHVYKTVLLIELVVALFNKKCPPVACRVDYSCLSALKCKFYTEWTRCNNNNSNR